MGARTFDLLSMSMEIQRGVVAQMMGDRATVIPDEHPDVVTLPLVVPFYWRETMGNLRENEAVFFFEDDSHEGFIIGRCDGNWDNTIRGSISVTESVNAKNVDGSDDVTGGGKSLKSHTHTSGQPGAPTSAPN